MCSRCQLLFMQYFSIFFRIFPNFFEKYALNSIKRHIRVIKHHQNHWDIHAVFYGWFYNVVWSRECNAAPWGCKLEMWLCTYLSGNVAYPFFSFIWHFCHMVKWEKMRRSVRTIDRTLQFFFPFLIWPYWGENSANKKN